MADFPDPPEGWLELQLRMARATTPEEINELVKEMDQVLDKYETRLGSGRRSRTSPDLRSHSEARKSE